MLTIDRLILRLPPELAGREAALGRAIAEALCETPPAGGDLSMPRLSAVLTDVSAHCSNADIARAVVARVRGELAGSTWQRSKL